MNVQELVTDFLEPAPFPFIPLPKGLVNKLEGLSPWKAWATRGNMMEELGTVWGADENEAIEAAENIASKDGRFTAVRVERNGWL